MILIINPGSSSIKFTLFDKKSEIFHGSAEMGDAHITISYHVHDKTYQETAPKEAFSQMFEKILQLLHSSCVVKDFYDIKALGIRIVHGGTYFKKTTRITTRHLPKLKALNSIAPLHNPPALSLIEYVFKKYPSLPIYGVFDTTFHRSIPEYIANYALPKAYEYKFGMRKYGFHGISCQSILAQLKTMYPTLPEKIIICHLGSGSSITAVKDGKSLDTSMGFTPLEGIIMRTRGGDMDPGVVLEIFKHLSSDMPLSDAIKNVEDTLNYESGLKALSGGISDMRTIIELAKGGNTLCKNALKSYIYHIQKYIGSYYAILGGCDVLVFTAGTGEGSWYLRSQILKNLSSLKMYLNLKKNKENKIPSKIQAEKSNSEIIVLHTQESQSMFQEINMLLDKEE